MLNRRTLRIKVMQIIYGCEQTENYAFEAAKVQLLQNINKTHNLYLYVLLLLREVAGYVKQDKERRNRKYLPTEEDKNLNLQLYNNPLVQKLYTDTTFNEMVKREKLIPRIDPDVVKQLYREFSKDNDFLQYNLLENPTRNNHIDILKTLFTEFLLKQEIFISHIDEIFSNWEDDADIVTDTIKTLFYQFGKKGAGPGLTIFAHPDDWNEKLEFCTDLLRFELKYNTELLGLIQPQLEHWDVERLTQIDIILLKMALCEFLYFPTIPTKVTINEYIEIAKLYSTPSSKTFVNGVLDKLMKILKDEGRIKKSGRGLVEFD